MVDKKYTTHQFTHFIYHSYQDKFKNQKIIKIHQVHQQLQAEQFYLFCYTCFLFVMHLNLKQLRFSGEPVTQYTCESHENMNCMRTLEDSLPCHATSNRILSKVQKSFWSCTHVNSCQKYTLYINLHILLNILLNILSNTTSNIQESRKSIKSLKR